MKFIDKIENRLKIVEYLQLLLPESMCKKKDQIIQIFSLNQKAFRQEFFMEEFEKKNAHILICINTAQMRINI